jgi:O-methyltransferase involved in polyketide biosynthesis
MAKEAANTGIMPTVLVAIEKCFPKSRRVIDDPLAVRMLPLGADVRSPSATALGERFGPREKNDPGIWSSLLFRKRYI